MKDTGPAAVTLFLCGDVMPGRGIDQILPCPSEPGLHEPWVQDAREYVGLAEQVSGSIPRAVPLSYVWGDTLDELRRRRPHARIVNLETSITTCTDHWPKGINYRLHPDNAGLLPLAADTCALANNHVLDFGRAGLDETLRRLRALHVRTAGAGATLDAARAPAVIPLSNGRRILAFAAATLDSGVPESWAASAGRSGIHLLGNLAAQARPLAQYIAARKRSGDLSILSVHWGDNWGFDIPPQQIDFAHALIDSGSVDLIHGHSSHHIKGIEIYRGKLIFYGCGDYLNDYEGIAGHESFGPQLGYMYFPILEPGSGRVRSLELVSTRIRRFRVQRASPADRCWLHNTLARECGRLGSAFTWGEDDVLLPA